MKMAQLVKSLLFKHEDWVLDPHYPWCESVTLVLGTWGQEDDGTFWPSQSIQISEFQVGQDSLFPLQNEVESN